MDDDQEFVDWDYDDDADEQPGLLADIVSGAVAGLVATAPMSLAMALMKKRLPLWQRYALPPRQLTERVAERLNVFRNPAQEKERKLLATALHFGYGAFFGAIYKPVSRFIPLPDPLRGALFGGLVWSGSYLGWLPAFDLHRPGHEQPGERRSLMIAANVFWGAVTAVIAARLEGNRDY